MYSVSSPPSNQVSVSKNVVSPRRHLDHADADLGVDLAGLGIAELERLGVERPEVGHLEVARAALVELEEGDVAAVGAPPEPVAEPELLLVDPVERPVDDAAVRAVRRERPLLARLDVDHVEVPVADEGDPLGRRVELGEHLEAGVAVGNGGHGPGLAVVDVVEPLRVEAPDALGVLSLIHI